MIEGNNKIKQPSKWELFTIRFLVMLGVTSVLNFAYHFFKPEYKSNTFLYILLAITIIYGILRKLYMWYHYLDISVPQTPKGNSSFSVDILTTYFPGEPYEMIEETLTAIQNITYPHTTYLCDEANDPYLIAFCKKTGVKHVTRFNRINAKAGNINNTLKQATGDICVILDPDHVPEPHFLDSIIPHFNNPEIGFVQIVQSYYNLRETLVAKGAAEQTFQFYGPMMMTMNSYGTVNAIGANCTFRRAALDSINGHAPGLAEDMHTAMLLHAKGWKSVYVPQVLARGLAPSSLVSFYKQQLKWARGTFDLLFKVYPKLFKNFTRRQKIHYGLLPWHYFIGIVYLFSFLIPIVSLLGSRTPWNGNFLYFVIITLPVALSALLIRSYIQKWVIEKKERGFHLIGGLLQITTWWIYLLGFVYTLVDKKVPYLPTPKEDDEKTHLIITIPNIIIGLVSIFSVIYGLAKDFTPFSLIMAGFATLNAFFMFFSVYLTTQSTNKNRILRSTLNPKTVSFFVKVKGWVQRFSSFLFGTSRRVALPLLILSLLISQLGVEKFLGEQWENVNSSQGPTPKTRYSGIFFPSSTNGKSDIRLIKNIASETGYDFNIISLYHAWNDQSNTSFPEDEINEIYKANSIPMISWEPWGYHMKARDSLPDLKQEKQILKYISSGALDNYIYDFAHKLKDFDKPIFLRFAHEFDNPNYPWSEAGNNSPDDFKKAWIHIYDIFKKERAINVIWVWNPWGYTNLKSYFPGTEYVDWIGITCLNYGELNQDGNWYDFKDIYHPYSEALKKLPKKPVMLAEFGSLKLGGNQTDWIDKAITEINNSYKNIRAVVFFNSNLDKNIPKNDSVKKLEFLDWSMAWDSIERISKRIETNKTSPLLITKRKDSAKSVRSLLSKPQTIRGVVYKKAQNWASNYYVPSREELKRDIKLMKQVCINTIKYQGPTPYEHNITTITKEEGLKLIYSLYVPSSLNFTTDNPKLKKLEETFISRIKAAGSHSNIIAWSLGNGTWSKMSKYHDKPVLFYQRKAYCLWIKKIISKIKELDKRPVILDVNLSSETEISIEQFQKNGAYPDYYGLMINSSNNLNSFMEFASQKNVPYIISQAATNMIPTFKDKVFIIENWQDQRESHRVTFDGLLDFKGRKKTSFKVSEKYWKKSYSQNDQIDFKILRPSIVITQGKKAKFHALMLKNTKWEYANKNDTDYSLEWWMIKNDPYGNPIAVKELGKGPIINLYIPKNYTRYRLMLKILKEGSVKSITTTLNTPLNKTDNYF